MACTLIVNRVLGSARNFCRWIRSRKRARTEYMTITAVKKKHAERRKNTKKTMRTACPSAALSHYTQNIEFWFGKKEKNSVHKKKPNLRKIGWIYMFIKTRVFELVLPLNF